MDFPPSWDKTNKYAIKQYNKCKKYYELGEEDIFNEVFVPSSFFNIFCIFVLVYTFLSLFFIIIKREVYVRMKWSVKLSILFTIGTILNVSNFYVRRLKFFDYPCFLVPYISGIGYPLNFFSCSGHILLYLKQCYANASLYNKHTTDDSHNKFKNKGYLTKMSANFTETKLIKILLIYITGTMFYIVLLSVFDIDYTMHPISHGFCTSEYEQGSEYILIFGFVFVFVPMAIHDIQMFGKSFSFGKTSLISLALTGICILIYILISYDSYYLCTRISRYLPIDFYIVLLFFIFHVSFITVPLIQSYITNKHIEGLELTKKGLIKIFDDELLYKEFFEYAVSKRSVEYVLFHIEYKEFKEIFRVNQSFFDDIKTNGLLTPGPNPTNTRDRKAVQVFEEIYQKTDDIYNKYFMEDSELELNLPGKLIKNVTSNLYNYNLNFGRRFINAEEGQPVDLEQINCETLFDDVHEEAIDSLFLNVYSSFAKDKKKLLMDRSSKDGANINNDSMTSFHNIVSKLRPSGSISSFHSLHGTRTLRKGSIDSYQQSGSKLRPNESNNSIHQ